MVYQGDALYLEAIIENAEIVSWLHEDQILNSNKNKIIIKFLNGKASLRIDGIAKKHGGEYICLAETGSDPLKSMKESVYCHVTVIDGKISLYTIKEK